MGAGFGGVIGVCGCVVGILILLVFGGGGGGGQVTWCGGFLRFALDGGFLLGFSCGTSLFAG